MTDLTSAKIIADSNINGNRIITIETFYPLIIHAEVLRTRTLSHSVGSARAIPFKKYIENYVKFTPSTWRKNTKGMSPTEFIEEKHLPYIKQLYSDAMRNAKGSAQCLAEMDLAKESCNRLLAPFSYVRDLITGKYEDWLSFFELRLDSAAQYEIQIMASNCKEAIDNSTPVKTNLHLPYIDDDWKKLYNQYGRDTLIEYIKQSVARIARTSYDSNATGKISSLEEDLELYNTRLANQTPAHLSPLEAVVLSDRLTKELFNIETDKYIFEVPFDNKYEEEMYQYNEIDNKLLNRYRYPLSGNLGCNVVQLRKLIELGIEL